MKKIALYPGSFDPITYGHIDILDRASVVFDHVLIAIFDNPNKNPLFSVSERKLLIQQAIEGKKNISIDVYSGLLAEYAVQKSVSTIIRGLRAVSDFEYEFQMALTNRQLSRQLDTMFLMTDQKYSYLSSSIVKQVCQFGGNISAFVPLHVEKALRRKYSE